MVLNPSAWPARRIARVAAVTILALYGVAILRDPGFTLIDNGATNGCYVNDRKVTKHELVDNDMITLGKTNFKFKSIN